MTRDKIIEMAREAAPNCLDTLNINLVTLTNEELERFSDLVRADEREKLTAVGEVKDGAFGGFVWNEGITSDEAPDGAVLYVRSEK